MLKLVKLELKKIRIKGFLKGAVITSFILLIAFIISAVAIKVTGVTKMESFKDAVLLLDGTVRDTFIIFSSVLLSRLIVDEYRNKTIALLFMYPINRKKLMAGKLIILCSFTFLAIFLTDIFISTVTYGINSLIGFIPNKLSLSVLGSLTLTLLMNSLMSACLSLIPLYFGMRKKSVPMTVVTSIILVSIIGSSTSGFTLFSIIYIPLSLSALGLFIAYLFVVKVEQVDAL